MMQKRTALKLVLAGAAAAMLAGCGDKTEAPKEAAAPEKAAAAPADKAAGPYKVAFVYVSPASEEGWSRQHDLARIALEKVYGDKVKFTTVENTFPPALTANACCATSRSRATSSSLRPRSAT